MRDEGDFADFSVSSAVVAFLARPGEYQIIEAAQQILTSMVGEPSPERQRHRVEAARLLGELPDRFDPLLSNLIADPDAVVAREAIHSAAKLHKRRLVPQLLDCLANPKLRARRRQSLGGVWRHDRRIVTRLSRRFLGGGRGSTERFHPSW